MSNKKYGSLTVLKFAGNGKIGAKWLCKCDCGKEKIVCGYYLRQGIVKTCGCRININENLIGKRFGRLIVLREAGRHKNRCILWKCKCDCGNIKISQGSSLKNGDVKSCGCLRKIKKGQANFNNLYGDYKKHAKIKKISFSLTKEEFGNLTKENCFYCGVEPKQQRNKKHSNGVYMYNGIDRKDNKKGYVLGNVLPCCSVCNKAKRDMSYKDFMLWIEKICINQRGVFFEQ